MNKINTSIKMTNERKCPFRDNILVERTNPATTSRCPDRDNILVEHIAYLTVRSRSRGYSISTNIASLTGCRNTTAWRFLPSDASLTWGVKNLRLIFQKFVQKMILPKPLFLGGFLNSTCSGYISSLIPLFRL